MSAPAAPSLDLKYTSDLIDTGKVFQFTGAATVSQESVSNFPISGFTISCWLKCASGQNDAVIWSYDASAGSVSHQVYLKNPSNLVIGIGSSAISPATGVAVDDDYWHHLAITILPATDQKSFQIGIYKDGVKVFFGLGAVSSSSAISLEEHGDLVLGQSPDAGAASQFAGYMSEFRLWKGIQSAASIMTNMQQRLSASDDLLICWALSSADSSGTVSGGAFVDTGNLVFLSTKLEASWNAVTDATTYDFEISSDKGYFSYAQNGITETSISIPGTDLNTAYTAKVRAENADGKSDWVTAQVTEITLQGFSQTLSNPSGDQISSSWQAANQASAYQVSWYKNGSASADSKANQTATTLDLSSKVTDPDAWSYDIRAFCLNSLGPATAIDSISGLAISLSYQSEILSANWTITSTDIQYYYLEIFKKDEANGDTSIFSGVLPGTDNSKSLLGEYANNETYYAKIRAITNGNFGAWEQSTDIVIQNFLAPIISDANGDATTHSITVNWGLIDSDDPNLKYQLQLFKTGESDPISTSDDLSAETKSYVFNNSQIVKDSSFTVQIRAHDGASTSPWSEPYSVCVNDLPQVQNVMARVTEDNNVTVSWDAVTGVNGITYTVELKGPKEIPNKTGVTDNSVVFEASETHVVKDEVYQATVLATKGDETSCPSLQTPNTEVTIGKVTPNPNNPGSSTVSDPVTVSDGSYAYSHVDMQVASPFPLQFITYYNTVTPIPSENPVYTGNPMGLRWNHNYNTRIVTNTEEKKLYVIWGSGKVFAYTIPNSITGNYPPEGIPDGSSLVFDATSTYILTTKQQEILKFNSSGVLQSIESSAGNLHSLSYSGSKLDKVEDSASGRSFSFDYDGDNIKSVTDNSGRKISYAYSDGKLTTFTDVMNKTIVFTYDDSSLMETITNQNDILILKNVYSDAKVVKQYDGVALSLPAADQYYTGFDYSESEEDGVEYVTCTVTDREGNTSTYKSVKANGNTVSEIYDLGDGNERNISRVFDGFNNVLTEIVYEGPTADFEQGKGNKTTYVYDGANNVISKTNPIGQIESSTYNDQNLLLTHTDVLGNTTSYAYTGNLLKEITNPLNQKVSLTYEDGSIKGLVKTFTDFNGNTTTFSYDANANISKVTSPLGNIIDINSYDDLGRKLQEENQDSGGTLMFTRKYSYWDSDSLKTREEFQAGQPSADAYKYQYEYDGIEQLTQETDPLNQVTTYTYNKNDLLESRSYQEFQSNTVSTQYQYDKNDHLKKVLNNSEISSQYEYDIFDRLKKYTDPMGEVYTNTYVETASGSSYNEAITEVFPKLDSDPDNTYQTVNTYDGAGRLISAFDKGASAATSIAYSQRQDPDGSTQQLIITQTLPPENEGDDPYTTESIFDALGRIVSYKDEAGNITTTAYTLKEDTDSGTYLSVETQTDPEGNQYIKTYDAENRIQEIFRGDDSLSQSQQIAYDAISRITQVTNADQVTKYTYAYDADTKGIAISIGKPGNDEAQSVQIFNALSKRIRDTDALGKSRSWEYAPWGSISKYTNANAQALSFSFDSAARFYKTTLPNGTDYIEHTLDKNGNRLSTATNTTVNITRTFDNWNRLLSRTNAQSKALAYEYFPSNQIKTITYPDGTSKVNYAYNGLNRLATVTDWNAKETAYTYWPTGQTKQSTFANSTVCNTSFNKAGGLTGIEYLKDTAILSQVNITEIDALGNRKAANLVLPLSPNFPSKQLTLVYNAANEMSNFDGDDLTYDDNGNLLKFPDASGLKDMTYNEFDQVTALGDDTYTYDDDGMRESRTIGGTQEFFVQDVQAYQSPMYEMADEQRSLDASLDILDLFGNEVLEPAYGAKDTIVPLQQALNRMLEITNADGDTQYRYVYGHGLISQEDSSGNVLNYLYDANGSTIARTDGDGAIQDRYAYTPYGLVKGLDANTYNPFLYNGRDGVIDDGNGLNYMRARYYAPTMLRFVQRDYLFGTVYDPQTQNHYSYASNNPASHIDPLGLSTARDVAIGVVGGIIGLGAGLAITGYILGGGGTSFGPAIGGGIGSRISGGLGRLFSRGGRYTRLKTDAPNGNTGTGGNTGPGGSSGSSPAPGTSPPPSPRPNMLTPGTSWITESGTTMTYRGPAVEMQPMGLSAAQNGGAAMVRTASFL